MSEIRGLWSLVLLSRGIRFGAKCLGQLPSSFFAPVIVRSVPHQIWMIGGRAGMSRLFGAADSEEQIRMSSRLPFSSDSVTEQLCEWGRMSEWRIISVWERW